MSVNSVHVANFFVARVSRLSLNKIQQIPSTYPDLYDFLSSWLACPNVLEAIYLASPSLIDRLEEWHKNPESKSGRKVTKALLKYLIRMSGRATPFGLFSGVAIGFWGSNSELAPVNLLRDDRKTRLDMFYLNTLQHQWPKCEEGQHKVKYIPNKTSYKVGDYLHYIESYQSSSQRLYRLSSVGLDDALQSVLLLAVDGKTKIELINCICDKHPDVNKSEAIYYVEQLIQEQVLEAKLKMPITGMSADKALLQSFEEVNASILVGTLDTTIKQLSKIDTLKNANPTEYREIYKQLQQLPFDVSENKLFQTDVLRNLSTSSLDIDLVEQLQKVLLALQASNATVSAPLKSFVDKFQARFEGQCVSLLTLLDDEIGIPFSDESGYETPLLEGVGLGHWEARGRLEPTSALETQILSSCQNYNKPVVQFNSEELIGKKNIESLWSNIPASFAVNISIYKDEQGVPLIHYHNCHGPSGANWIGRFCHLSEDLLEHVRDYLAEEESLSPEVIFAEIAHMPEGRPGNVVSRPTLRNYEIVFMADSSLPESQQIKVQDLYVYLEQGQVKLWWSKSNKQVVPRLTCAHNYSAKSLSVYRFLCMLQHQTANVPHFVLPKTFEHLEYIPRIKIDNVILQEAKWVIERKTLEGLRGCDERCEKQWSDLQRRYFLPRYVCYAKGDNVLTIDLLNPLMIELLLDETVNQLKITLKESLQMQYQNVARSNEGEFSHEIIVPMLNSFAKPHRTVKENMLLSVDETIQRKFAPGSDWLSLKIYAAQSTVEILLVKVLTPVLQQCKQEELFNSWFFIRYGDPDWHLRLRIYGEPSVLTGRVLFLLKQALEPWLNSLHVNKIELSTYEREIERYGGLESIALCERVFQADSYFVLSSLMLSRKYDEQIRWRMALLGVDAMLTSFGYDLKQKLELVSWLRQSFGAEFNETAMLRSQLGRKYRENYALLSTDFQALQTHTNDKLLLEMLGVRQQYLESLQPVTQKILAVCKSGKLSCSLDTLLHSLLHMLNNRMFKAYGREQEFVVYDFLRRFYLSSSAREMQ